MNETGKEKKERRHFIRERIVPKKRWKKPLYRVLAIIGSAVLFGLVAAAVFYLSGGLFGGKEESKSPTIVIARDDTAEVLPTEAEDESGETEESRNGNTAVDVYGQVQKSIGTLTVSYAAGPESFSENSGRIRKSPAALIAESETSYFLLTDRNLFTEAVSAMRLNMNGFLVETEYVGSDEISGIAIISVSKDGLKSFTKASFANSFSLSLGERVYYVGSLSENPISLSSGEITHYYRTLDVTDGYEQVIYTDILREEGDFGVVLNADAEIVGVMNGKSNQNGTVGTMYGIGPLKYIIEDLCSRKPTAYLGICGANITEADAIFFGQSSGYYVREVRPESPAYLAGIQNADEIVEIDGKKISGSPALLSVLDEKEPGDALRIKVRRAARESGNEMEIQVVLEKRFSFNE